MEQELESAMLSALARAEAGEDVSQEWLRATHPRWWRDVEEFLRMHRRLEAGRPEIATVGPYVVRRRLGEGGMGTVYLAEAGRGHPTLRPGTPVAVKVVHAHLMSRPRIVERTLREARLGAAVVHENVVKTLDAGHGPATGAPETHGGTALYVVTEHVPGQSLRGVLDETGRLPEDLCRRVARDVLRALVAIHAAGAVHRDLKPENVLLSREGRVVVTDLGAARILDGGDRITRSGEFLGSLAYAAPEQVLRPAARADVRSDLYSLGVMLHELADGRHPCTADDPGERRASDIAGPERALPARTDSPRTLRASVSPFFRAFIAALSAHEPDARFPSAAAALEALEGAERSAWWRDAKSRTRTAPRPAARTLIGRDEEVARLVEAAREAAAGRAQFVVVTGEAGSGKSHLAESVAARIVAESPAFARITVHHDPGAAARPAGEPWIDALRAHLDGMTDAAAADLAAACSADAPALAAPFLAALRREPASPLGADATHRAASAYLRAVAAARPVLLVVEDVHVADAEARRRVAALAEDLAGARVFVLVTRRPPAPDDDAIPRDDARIEHIDLRRLPADAVARLVEHLTGSAAAAERLAPTVARRSDGLPYFVIELVRHFADTGVLVPTPRGAWEVAADPAAGAQPPSLRAAVEQRLQGLAPDDRRLLDTAALCGFVFDPEIVAQAVGRSSLDVLRAFARLGRAQGGSQGGARFVRSAGARCSFDHHVVQEVLASALDEAAARPLHAGLARALEARAAADTTELTADTALAVFSHAVRGGEAGIAARHLTLAVRALDVACPTLEAVDLLRRVLELPGAVAPARRPGILVDLAPFLHILARRDEELAVLREALTGAESVGDDFTAARARSEIARCLGRLGRNAEALGEANTAIALARRAGNRDAEEVARAVAGVALVAMNRVDEGIAQHEAQLALACAAGAAERESDAHDCLGTAKEYAGEIEDAIAHFRRSLELIRAMPALPAYPGLLRLRLAHCLTTSGRWDEVAGLAAEQERLSRRIGDRQGETWAQFLRARLEERAGRRDDAIRITLRGADLAPSLGDPPFALMARRLAASLLLRAGRTGDALRQSRAARTIADEIGLAPALLLCDALDAEAHSLAGRHDEAMSAARSSEARAAAIGLHRGRRAAVLALGRVANAGRGDPALLAQAADMARADGDAIGTAAILLELGLAVSAGAGAGDSGASAAEARPHLEHALTAGRRFAAPELVAPAAARLAALGFLAPDAAAAECAPLAAAVPVRLRVLVEEDLFRATGDPAHQDEARRHAALIDRAPPPL